MTPIKHTLQGTVIRTMVGLDPDTILSTAQASVQVTFAGIEGDHHAGLTRISSGSGRYARGTEIRNERQVTIVSVEELAAVAQTMGIPEIGAEWICANLLIEGIPALTQLTPSTRLYFSGGVTLVVEGENPPCTGAGASIQSHYPDVPDLTTGFPKAAIHKRGLLMTVERPGVIAAGESVRAEVPDLPAYSPGAPEEELSV
ncbi:MAG TPA: hypothetical protein PKD09_15340 [Aggregatilinea sp.]|uniref:MOSC domain-containing protein n=1 Tax=Aggregatilinea sp. TaxID=2806333 RepID=UPI002C7ACF3F|nr:hypothetical protein [Aggregatilinea sp.]HML23026.1 hypothetical protein [Aggregatilinea sp.]